MREYKSFYKTVAGNEGSKCKYPTRLDTYGCGCAHNCEYCYARSLLEFRKLWHLEDPAVADIEKIKRKLDKIEPGTILRFGGMTDCFQPAEKKHRVTYQLIKELNKRRIGYLIVTKSAMIADDEYTETLEYSPKADEMVLTVHRWFANKSCPGNWLYSRLGKLADEVTKQLGGSKLRQRRKRRRSPKNTRSRWI